MNREQKIDICTMRIDGSTIYEIADKYGVSHQYISESLRNLASERSYTAGVRKVIYPRVKKWLAENSVSFSVLSKRTGISQQVIGDQLTGRRPYTMRIVAALMKETGLSFEALTSQEAL